MLSYRIKLTPDDNGTLLVTCPGLPGVTTFGKTRADALAHAVGAIEEWIASEIADGRDVPRSRAVRSLKRNEAVVSLPGATVLELERHLASRRRRSK